MSLQTRVIVLVGAVLLVSIALGAALAGFEGRVALASEISAGLRGGAQTVRSAYRALPGSAHPAQDLRQLVAAFDGDRHVTASLEDARGVALAVSRPGRTEAQAPAWFRRLVAPAAASIAFPVPALASPMRLVRLRSAPEADVGALWTELSGLTAVLTLATLLCLALVSLTVRAALAPLRGLSLGLRQIGGGDYRSRVAERGPPEVLELERSFNAMAERLAGMERLNGELERQLLTIQDEERAEIARDLHDEVGPQLFAVSLDAQLINQLLAAGRVQAVKGQVEAIQTGVRHVQREIRTLVARLRPARATELGLAAAIEDLTRFWLARRPEIVFAVEAGLDEAALDGALKDTAFRIVQEAVSNAVRHAHPERIAVVLAQGPDALAVRVRNDGVPRDRGGPGRGFGLDGMRERVRAAGGRLEVGALQGEPGAWSVQAVLPLCASAASGLREAAA